MDRKDGKTEAMPFMLEMDRETQETKINGGTAMTIKRTFTQRELVDYRDYEAVRLSGLHNMFDPKARAMSGLTKEEYLFVMKNYTEMRKQDQGETL